MDGRWTGDGIFNRPQPPATARNRAPGLSRSVVVGAVLVAVLGLVGEALIFANYLQVNRTVRPNFARAALLLPQLSGLRTAVLQLHAQTTPLLTADIPDYRRVQLLRPDVEQRLAELRQASAGIEQYAPALDLVGDLLLIWDRQMEVLRGQPDPTQLAVTTFELQRSFDLTETTLGDLYAAQEQDFYSSTDQAFRALGNVQAALLGLGVLIAVVGGLLSVILRRSVRSEIERAYDRLQVAADVGRAASSILDVDSLLGQVVGLIRDRFGYDHVSVFLLDESGERAVLREATGEAGARLKAAGHALAVGSQSIIGWVTANRQLRLAGDVGADPVHLKNELLPDTRSELAFPLVVRDSEGREAPSLAHDRLLGALDVQSRARDAFGEVDVRALQALADQVAIAIANAAEYGTQQARSVKLAALSEAALQLAEPQASLADLLDLAARRAMTVIKCDSAALWLPVSPEEIELKVWYRGQSVQPAGRRLPTNQGVVGRIWSGVQPAQAASHAASPSIVDRGPFTVEGGADGLPGPGGSVSAGLAVPMVWQAGVTGLLVLARFRPGARFNEEDRNVARLFASQSAAAIENFRLIAETRARVAELSSLNLISTALTREAPTDLSRALSAAAEQMQRLVGVDHARIVLLDADNPAGDTAAAEGLDWGVAGSRYPLSDFPLIRQALESREVVVVESVGQDSRLGDAARSELLRSGVQAVTFVPLVVGERGPESGASKSPPQETAPLALGFAVLETVGHQRRLDESEIDLCRTIAAQLAIAVQNARLFEQHSRRARRERLINEITDKIRRSADVRSVLATTAAELAKALGASRARVEVGLGLPGAPARTNGSAGNGREKAR